MQLGARVRLTALGRERLVSPATRKPREFGTVIGGSYLLDRRMVSWDGRRMPELLHTDFIEIVESPK